MVQDLEGKRVLLILLKVTNPQNTYLVTGVAHWKGSTVEIVPDGGTEPIAVRSLDVERNGFGPERLRHLVGSEEYLPLSDQLSREVTVCVPLVIETVPSGPMPTPGFVGGLALGRDGALFLMEVR